MPRSKSPSRLPQWRISGKLTTRRRPATWAILLIGAVSLFFTYRYLHSHGRGDNGLIFSMNPETVVDLDVPPTWEELKKWERELPQHNLDLPFPEGKTGRYVYFKSEIYQLGWNNVLNERLMNTYLAYKSKLLPLARTQTARICPHTPLPALIAGPSAGGPWDPEDEAPRSVSKEWYDVVCPPKDRRIISTGDVKPDIMWDTGDVIFRTWEKLLRDAPERCIEIQSAKRSSDNFPQVFDLYLWGSDRILPLWEEFSKSPVSRLLATAPVVSAQVKGMSISFGLPAPPSVPASRNPYERMLAIHLRRGDYKEACKGLAQWNSTFYSWNLLPSLPDKFTPPPGGEWGKNTPENEAKYFVHCLPTFDFIVEKIRNSRADYIKANPKEPRMLDVLYLLTNDESDWLDNLKATLANDGWYTIRTTRDLILSQEGKDVNMAVDMDIARKAAVFIGNGWSSFTSNIVHRRLVDGKAPISNRFY
ncbi:hypothetical protein BDQ17DRAFT_1399176 [Cyathus striatus]|nr:hypothetical protein BDQ17DRAFT_1399176 [Cyathus striatus]